MYFIVSVILYILLIYTLCICFIYLLSYLIDTKRIRKYMKLYSPNKEVNELLLQSLNLQTQTISFQKFELSPLVEN